MKQNSKNHDPQLIWDETMSEISYAAKRHRF